MNLLTENGFEFPISSQRQITDQCGDSLRLDLPVRYSEQFCSYTALFVVNTTSRKRNLDRNFWMGGTIQVLARTL